MSSSPTPTTPTTSPTPTTPTTIVKLKRSGNKLLQSCDIYIGRACFQGGWQLPASKWANPYSKAACHGSVITAVAKYESYIRQRPDLLAQLPELHGKVLGCWCKDRPSSPCHGDVLVRLLKELHQLD